LFKIIVLVTLLVSFVIAKEKEYRFAPLSTKRLSQNIKDFLPLGAYFEGNFDKINIDKYKALEVDIQIPQKGNMQ
jgi:hypothetical protein